jgi:ribokinase
MEFDIVSFGSAVVDTFIHTNVYEKKNFITYPVGGKILIDKLKFDIGGGGTNTAVAFARLGLKTGCITKIGDDKNGVDILQCLKKENVKYLGHIDKEHLSGYSAILDSRGGERTILTYKGANDHIEMSDIPKLTTKWLYYSSLLGKSFETQERLAIKMHKNGTKIAFNPSSYLIKNMDLKPLLNICDVLILNKEEAEMLLEKNKIKEKNLLNGLRELGPRIVVITDKDKPAKCFDGVKEFKIMPHKNIKAVERTGAGDAFASGFVAGLVVSWPLQKCLELGLKESESVIQYFGAKNILLSMDIKKK